MEDRIKHTIETVNIQAQYDACAKELLSNKIILAHILKGTVEEFQDMEPDMIVSLIEGEPYVGNVPVEPGLTNQVMQNTGGQIKGTNTEDSHLGEGKIYYDIIFYVRLHEQTAQMIINIEAQRSATPGYSIVNRAIYYTSRMISSQKERDFFNSDYDAILKTYSIWICFNIEENCLNHLCLEDHALLGKHAWGGKKDLFNVVLVGLDKQLTKSAIDETESNLHYLLGTLFSNKLEAAEKIHMLDEKFQMQIEKSQKIRKELTQMCNLSYVILEEGMEKGMEKGMEEGMEKGMEKGRTAERINFIREMLQDHQSYALIKKYTGASEEEIKQVEEMLFVK